MAKKAYWVSAYRSVKDPDKMAAYAKLAGRTIYSLVADAKMDAERYRYLKAACSSHHPMTHEQPAEWSIGWEFQQRRPDEAYGSFDSWIDRDIAERAERQAKIDAEEAAEGANYVF